MPGFTKWEILPLRFADRVTFVKKWFDVVSPGKGERLIERCKDRPELLDLGSNPLLLSIVCALYDNDLDVPEDPDELYSRSVHGLLGGWDAFRNISRSTPLKNLSVERRITLATWLAYHLFAKGKIVFSSRHLHTTDFMNNAAIAIRDELPPAPALVGTLYNDFGILAERSPNLYSFSHLTIQEYLVSSYLVENRLERSALKTHRGKSAWFEVFRLTAKRLPRGAAGLFLSELTENVKLNNRADARLVRAAWESKPLCARPLREKLLERLAGRLRSEVPKRSYSLVGDAVKLRDGSGFSRDAISDIYEIYSGSGFSFKQVGCRSGDLLELLERTAGQITR